MLRTPSLQLSNPLYFRIVGHTWFLILITYSLVYVAERFTYVDSAWQFFQRVNNEGFIFPSDRYGVIFSQIPVLILQKCGASHNVLVYTFSISFVLLYYLIWYLCTAILKNHTAGLAIIFCTFMGVREGFLHPVTETQQCLMFSVLLYALLASGIANSVKGVALAQLITLVILFTHPVGIFTAGFAAAMCMAEAKNFKSKNCWSVITVLVVFSLWRFLFPIDNYDASMYDQLKGNSSSAIPATNGALHFLWIHFPHFYWLPELAGCVVVAWLGLKREWIKLALTVIGVGTYVGIAAITFSQGDSSILMERAFLPACFMISLVLAGVIAQTQFSRKWIPVVIIVFFLFNGIRYINTGCLMYKKRVAYLDELVQRAMKGPTDKYILDEASANKEVILVPWALGVETLIYSKFKYNRCVTITLDKEGCDPLSARITTSLCLPVSDLNPEYFLLSSNPYQPLP